MMISWSLCLVMKLLRNLEVDTLFVRLNARLA